MWLSHRNFSAAAVAGRASSHAFSETVEHGFATRRFVPISAKPSATIVMLHGAGESGESLCKLAAAWGCEGTGTRCLWEHVPRALHS